MLESIDYKKIFYYFEQISAIPRGSKNNKGISDYLAAFADERGLFCIQDPLYNIIIKKPASKGCENSPAVIIQGHMDMVCEKEAGHSHDFTKEGLDLRIEGDFVSAYKTTLGADDGIAVAYALAILDDDTLVHPPLEIIITTDEEIGMEGAKGLDCSQLQGRYMLNLDSEEEGIFLSSCAGGKTAACHLPLSFKRAQGQLFCISVKGLIGGHSGVEIDKIRTNAVVLLGRLLSELNDSGIPYFVTDMYGGLKDNAIPREASAGIVTAPEYGEKLICKIKEREAVYKSERKGSDPGIRLEVAAETTGEYDVLEEKEFQNILMLLLMAPNAIQKMSYEIKGLVESSINLGIFRFSGERAYFSFSIRSSVSSYKEFMGNRLKHFIEFLGGSFEISGDYPAWEYKSESVLRTICSEVFKEQYGHEVRTEAIHAGLECGIIAGKMRGIDILSLGPDAFDIHTPKERLSISSAKRVYDFILKALERIAAK